MRTSVTLKTLIIISAAMVIAVLSFGMGYFSGKTDVRKFSDTYAVSVETVSDTPAHGSVSDDLQPNGGSAPININTASISELETLSGIGPVLAERIVAHREEYGEFKNKYNLMDVPGIGTGIYEILKDSICVSGQNEEEMEK